MNKPTVSLLTQIIGIHIGLPVQALYQKYKTAESNLLEVEGMPLHYRITGNGPNLLLIHGVTSSLHTWDGWHSALSKDFRVISFCVPGFGLTGPHPQNDYSLAMYMRVIDCLLDHLKINQCHMAGNSFGGYLAWNYALHKPNRLLKIVLLNAAGISTQRKDLRSIGFKLFINPFTKLLVHYFTPRPILKYTLRDTYGDPSKVTEELIDTYWYMLLRKGNRAAFTEVLDKTILHGKDTHPHIRKVTIPTLIIWGDKDPVITVKDAAVFQRLIPNATLIIYEGVGHMPMEEIPIQSASDAKSFLNSRTSKG